MIPLAHWTPVEFPSGALLLLIGFAAGVLATMALRATGTK